MKSLDPFIPPRIDCDREVMGKEWGPQDDLGSACTTRPSSRAIRLRRSRRRRSTGCNPGTRTTDPCADDPRDHEGWGCKVRYIGVGAQMDTRQLRQER